MIRARFLPTVITPCAGFIRRSIQIQKNTSNPSGSTHPSIWPNQLAAVPS